MTERMISGAEEPSAMSVRLATVAFHTFTSASEPSGRLILCVADVMTSMPAMKMSAMIPTPMKHHRRPIKYGIAMMAPFLYSWWFSPPMGKKRPEPPSLQMDGEVSTSLSESAKALKLGNS
jgi:hypothetical protein